jgi:hypothetical protein
MPIVSCNIGSNRRYRNTELNGPYTFGLEDIEGETLSQEDAKKCVARSLEKGLI